MRAFYASIGVPLIALAAACKPDLGAPVSLVDQPRYLAVVADPPEAKPGDTVKLHALIARPDGTVADDAPASWAVCTTSKPVSQNNAVSDDCIFEAQNPVPTRALSVDVTVPTDACARFGPDPPQSKPGEPPLRPVDPDPTGGYYQPVRSLLEIAPKQYIASIGLPRITCNLADAPIDVALAFRDRYVTNTNPVIATVLLSSDGVKGVDVTTVQQVHAGAEVTFLVRWTAGSAEGYPLFDRSTRTLVDRREALRVSWFTTAGEYEHDHTGAGEDDPAVETQNLWTAPATPGVVHLWVVLRDSRGGSDVRGFDVEVVP